jgi:NADH-quinone oxidoreductase subunit M
MFLGEFWVRDKSIQENLKDLNFREYTMLIPLLATIILLGIFPQYLMEYINPAVEKLTQMVQGI